MGSSTKERPRPTGPSLPSCPCAAVPRRIASASSASTATWFSASFAPPAPEPPYSHIYAGYSSRGLRRTMVLSAFIVVLLIGASYRGDPSADGPAKRGAQTISFAPSAGPGDINKLNKLTSTTKVGIFSGIDGLSFEMLDEMKKLDFKHWEDLRSTLGVSQTTLDLIKKVLHKHLKEEKEKEKEKEKAGSEADGWLAASSSSSAANLNPTQPEIAAEGSGSKKRKKQDNPDEFPQWIQAKFATSAYARADMKRQYQVLASDVAFGFSFGSADTIVVAGPGKHDRVLKRRSLRQMAESGGQWRRGEVLVLGVPSVHRCQGSSRYA